MDGTAARRCPAANRCVQQEYPQEFFHRMDVSAPRKLHFGSLEAPLKKKSLVTE